MIPLCGCISGDWRPFLGVPKAKSKWIQIDRPKFVTIFAWKLLSAVRCVVSGLVVGRWSFVTFSVCS